jgi:hypothetical protein
MSYKYISPQWFYIDETLSNFIARKPPKRRREKPTRGKDQSPGKQTAQKGPATE